MKQLWAPWRMVYIDQDSIETGCIFCNQSRGVEESPVVYYSRLEQGRWWDRLFFSVTGIQWSRNDRPGLRYEWSLSLLR